jgi:predicted nucleotidyltransferase
LRGLGIRELGLFGSFARGEARPDSDVDFFVDLDQKSFDRYMAVKELLEEILARKVDLVLKSAIKPRLRDVILREAVRAVMSASTSTIFSKPANESAATPRAFRSTSSAAIRKLSTLLFATSR